MHHTITIDATGSFSIALFVLLTGYVVNRKVSFLKHYSIPEPIIGGLFTSAFITTLHYLGTSLIFTLPLQNTFMLIFFASLGLSANWGQLKQGGVKVVSFVCVATVFIVGQNAVGIQISKALGLEPLFGLVAGSITLTGGHGTGAAWAPILESNYGLSNVMEVAMACATFGLIIGGMIGGPVANVLIKKYHLAQENELQQSTIDTNNGPRWNSINAILSRITPNSVTYTLFSLFICVAGATWLDEWVREINLGDIVIPNFVYALLLGVIITNVESTLKCGKIHYSAITFAGDLSLKLFLAMALLSLQLWNLVDLALPILVILLVQTLFQALFAFWVTFRVMGKDYDAAVIVGGHCGFGMGSTATAVMNMNTIVNRFSPSTQAFIVVPIVGAFFVDIINLLTLQLYLSFVG